MGAALHDVSGLVRRSIPLGQSWVREELQTPQGGKGWWEVVTETVKSVRPSRSLR